MFEDIAGSSTWKSIEMVCKGWSSDKKYKIITYSGESLLLRISSINQLDEKKKEYEIVSKYSKLGFPMSEPIDFGICNGNQNVYMLLTWLEGRDLEEVLPTLSEKRQYDLGLEAGRILKKLHSVKVDRDDIPNETKISKKLFQLEKYEKSNIRIENDDSAIRFVKQNIDKIWKEAPVYLHGDFHPGNLIYMEDGSIGVIDFNRWEVGDPYEEFYKLQSFARELSVPYCIGQIDSYFDNSVPENFWSALAVYVAHTSLYSITWAEKFGQDEINGMIKRCVKAFEDYDDFHRVIPVWYRK